MKNIRRFQRVILVGFVGINSIVYTKMEEFPVNEQLLLTASVITITIGLVLLSARIRKTTQHVK